MTLADSRGSQLSASTLIHVNREGEIINLDTGEAIPASYEMPNRSFE